MNIGHVISPSSLKRQFFAPFPLFQVIQNYDIINEHELRPIINVELNESSVYQALYELILHPKRINTLKRESMAYIKRHHDYINVAQKYIAFYEQLDH